MSKSNSPSRKRVSNTDVAELERNTRGSPIRKSSPNQSLADKESAKLFFSTKMKNLEDIIGPQFCSLCDRNIGQSVKIKSTDHEAAGKPIVVCLECHRTGAPVTA